VRNSQSRQQQKTENVELDQTLELGSRSKNTESTCILSRVTRGERWHGVSMNVRKHRHAYEADQMSDEVAHINLVKTHLCPVRFRFV
jgi:hypothetical protein